MGESLETIPCKVIIIWNSLEVKDIVLVQTTASNPVWLDVECIDNVGDSWDLRSWSQIMKNLLFQAKEFGLYPEDK